MLKGISPVISPDILKLLAEMGHGDTLVLEDCNYPAASTGKRYLRADGVTATDLLDEIMQLLPLDVDEQENVENAVALMRSTDNPKMKPEIWSDFKDIVSNYEPHAKFDYCDRFEFYEKAKNTFVCIQMSEEKYFDCVTLRKSVWFSKNNN